MQKPPRATFDFETRSACSLKACGSWRYSLDPTTEVLCMAFRLPTWDKGRTGLWHPAFPHLDIEEGPDFAELEEFFAWILAGNLVEAHNAFFERGIWVNKCRPQFGWPAIAHEQWRCSAAKAATYALPRGLEGAGEALDLLVQKDTEGAKASKKTRSPRKPTQEDIHEWTRKHVPCLVCSGVGRFQDFKLDGSPKLKLSKCPACAGHGHPPGAQAPPLPLLYFEDRALFEQLWEYCRIDVLSEEAISERLPDLSPAETEMYLLDQKMNQRGFHLDTEGIDCALALIDQECVELNKELQVLTEGKVERATQRQRMLVWFEENGLSLDDTQGSTLDAALQRTKNPKVLRGLQLMKSLGRSSTAKFNAMKNWVCPDSKVHGGLLYHGATTGRWSGAGVQPHNFVRGSVVDMEKAWDAIKTGDAETLRRLPRGKEGGQPYGDVMEVLSHALRGAIVASPGYELFVADYSAIEARVLLWLANDQRGLDIFRKGEDIYCDMASSIYGHTVTKAMKDERALGKVAILGLGYQMGWNKFIETCEAMAGITIDEELAKTTVNRYRDKYDRVKRMWWRTEEAAIDAVLNEDTGEPFQSGKVRWFVDDGFLHCELPSGRLLGYPSPEVRPRTMPWGETKNSLTFMGVDPYTRQWKRQHTYGGCLVENITQAVARDLMAEAMLRAEKGGIYRPILSVHDELIAEAPVGAGNVEEFEKQMATCPMWAMGCPVTAEGWHGIRYRK